MGLGDEIMVTGEVKKLRATDSRKVQVIDNKCRPRWSSLWEGNTGIARLNESGDFYVYQNAGNCRPYIDYSRSTRQRWVFAKGYRATPGELHCVKSDPRGDGFVIIEPMIKSNASPAKQWGKWRQLVDTKAHRFAQMVPPGMTPIRGVAAIFTKSFEEACGVMMTAKGLILPEGGLHHAAAALGLKTVVLYGAATSPYVTGYDSQTNLWVDDPAGLGWRIRHAACDRAWDQITVEKVLCSLG